MKLLQALGILCAIVLVPPCLCGGQHVSNCTSNSTSEPALCFTTLFQFGASLFDTGNAAIAFPRQAFQPTRPPYGSTFPGYPAGRFSDGKLIIDYLADAFKLEPLYPFLESVEQTNGGGRDYRGGVCFSVALATALSTEELRASGILRQNITLNPLTSDVQFRWFQSFRKRVFESGTKSTGKLSALLPKEDEMANALYLPGEFGVNDYRVGLLSGVSVAELKKKVPLVVLKIVHLIKKLHGVGARNFLVIGVPPQGCSPFYLTMVNGTKDRFNCLAHVNTIHRLHDKKLKMALRKLRRELVDSNIMFADYYGAFMSVLKHPAKYGMKVRNVACCGGGGEYNYNPRAVCGTESSRRCSDPHRHVYWDDFHPTDELNKIIARKFTSGQYVEPLKVSL
ncbi:hypothetical protein KI387_010226, partial [Taxus chinensis]